MIVEYSRPKTVQEALRLLGRQTPKTIPLGGGTGLAKIRSKNDLAVVDLQALGMREIAENADFLEIGANVTLQHLHDNPLTPPAFKAALEMEGNFNLRQAATVGGTAASGGGGSAFNALLQVVEAGIISQPNDINIAFQKYFQEPRQISPGFISAIRIPLNCKIAVEKISRTPLSPPILCICGALLRGKFIRIVMPNPNSQLASILFEGDPKTGNPDLKQIVTQWSTQHPNDDAYITSVLPVMIDRVMNTLRKEG